MSKETMYQNYAVSHVNSTSVLSRKKYLLYSTLISRSGLVDGCQPDLIYGGHRSDPETAERRQ
jgi:hypothetical protein